MSFLIPDQHFNIGPQPHERARLQHRLLRSRGDVEVYDLYAEMGSAMAEATTDLTALHLLSPSSKIGNLALTLDRSDVPNDHSLGINFVIMPTSALNIHGMSSEGIHAWQKELIEAAEDTPTELRLYNPEKSYDDKAQLPGTCLMYDGEYFTMERIGEPFEITFHGLTILTQAWDRWRAWNYNATKRKQRRAERDSIANAVNQSIIGLNSSADAAAVGDILCTLGLFRDEYFSSAKYNIDIDTLTTNSTGDEVLAYKTAPENQFQIYLSHTEAPTPELISAVEELKRPLHEANILISDQTQLALLRYWYETQIGSYVWISHDPEILREKATQLAEQFPEVVRATNGAQDWELHRMRNYLLSLLQKEYEAKTKLFMEYFGGQRFDNAGGGAGFMAAHPYPELNQDKLSAPLADVLAVLEHEPPISLIEDVRALHRIEEDACISSDEDTACSLANQAAKLCDDINNRFADYFATLDKVADRYEEQVNFMKPVDDRAMLLEGIQLAKEITNLANTALAN